MLTPSWYSVLTQSWDSVLNKMGIVFCVYSDENAWTLSNGGPSQANGKPILANIIASGDTPVAITKGDWHVLRLTTTGKMAAFALDSHTISAAQAIRNIDTGFAAFGTNEWYS